MHDDSPEPPGSSPPKPLRALHWSQRRAKTGLVDEIPRQSFATARRIGRSPHPITTEPAEAESEACCQPRLLSADHSRSRYTTLETQAGQRAPPGTTRPPSRAPSTTSATRPVPLPTRTSTSNSGRPTSRRTSGTTATIAESNRTRGDQSARFSSQGKLTPGSGVNLYAFASKPLRHR